MEIFVLYYVYIDESGLMEEDNNGIRKVVACQLIQKTLPLHQNILVAMQYFAILRDTGESKRKEEFGKEICKSLRNEICKSQLA